MRPMLLKFDTLSTRSLRAPWRHNSSLHKVPNDFPLGHPRDGIHEPPRV